MGINKTQNFMAIPNSLKLILKKLFLKNLRAKTVQNVAIFYQSFAFCRFVCINRHVFLLTGKRPCLDLNSTFRHHWEEEEEEGHYEGPTIFDKVFRKSAHKSIETSR
jgi:hypothetical protein